MDDPDRILELIHYHPDFQAMYCHLYDMCQNVERVMNMFSKELQELDRNTVQLMIDEMQDTIDSQKSALNSQEHMIISQKGTIDSQEHMIISQKGTINSQKSTIDSQKNTIDSQKKLILELQRKLGISVE